ncbi:Fc receptor-like protein 5 [Haemorhous mexicanus]|uniref:Fc receptor-like protein 5 n=1 Tax=Haemorhous mexicanus TaxID=30427 RepID=UPI0028BE536F|nr:Fc receptor-like protein 5 [Haemorhous mexicanus]
MRARPDLASFPFIRRAASQGSGAQTTQLLLEPPWRPAVLWDPVTLTCQGLGTAGDTTWYKDGQRWWQKGRDHFTVTKSGTYTCDRPGSGCSPPVTVSNALTGPLCPPDNLVLQVPVLALLEGDTVTLRCRGWRNRTVTRVSFYREGEKLRGLRDGTELSLSPCSCTTAVTTAARAWWDPGCCMSQHRLELQVSARELLEGDTVTLRCLRWQNNPVTGVQFYHGDKEVGRPLNGAELSLSPLQLNHSGNYSYPHSHFPADSESQSSPPLSFPELFSVPVLEGPPEPTLGSPLTLSCLSTPSPLRPPAPFLHVFYREWQVLGGPQGSPQLLVPSVGVSHSGNYSCQVRSERGNVRKSSARLRVTVLMPVANATIIPSPLSHQVRPGDNVTLHCSVQVGSAPVTFTWLHNGQEVAQGPLLELRDIDVGHSGTYQCVATNQLGQDGHRVFRALSPELELEVTPGSPWVTAARKNQERDPPDSPDPPEEGQVLYTHVVVTKRGHQRGDSHSSEGQPVHMAGDTGMAGKVALLLWAQTLGLAGAQTTQLLVEPPWRPAVLWDQVTLTCQGLGTASDTTWYRDGQRWGQKGRDHVTVTESGTYRCDRPDTGLSHPVTVSNEWLVLQVPARALLEGDTVTLRCQSWQNKRLTDVYFCREKKYLTGPQDGTELSLSPLQLHHSGRYSCQGHVSHVVSRWSVSELVTVTVHRFPPSGMSLSAQPPGGQVALGDSLVLSCTVATGTGPRSFSWHREGSGTTVGTGPRLELQQVGDNDSGQYRCQVRDGDSVAESDLLNVTVLVPVANATITPGPLAHQVRPGDNVTLRCSVQVGSAPVTFTWLHNGQEVAQGPLLELRDIDVGHSGTYQCVATNQLGQDGHRVFRALSPELELEVTPGSPWVTVAAGVGGALLFLLLLVGVIVARHWWHCVDARKHQERAPPEPLAPSVEDPQATYMELQWQPWEPRDIYDNLHQKL